MKEGKEKEVEMTPEEVKEKLEMLNEKVRFLESLMGVKYEERDLG